MLSQYFFNIIANTIINNYFNSSYCLFIFTDDKNTFYYNGSRPLVYLTFLGNELKANLLFNHYGCSDIVIQTSNASSTLIQFETLIRLQQERFNNRRYLILPGENNRQDLDDIFKLEEINFIADILVMSANNYDNVTADESVVYLKTHKYNGKNNNNEVILLDMWFVNNQSFLYNNNLYPDKIYDQKGRVLKIATFTYKPYSIADSKTADGTEMQFALEYARIRNMTPMLIINYEDEWGDIYENWTGYGLLDNLVMDKGDLGFAALYTWEYEYHFLDLSKPLVRTGITCLVPAPKRAAGWLSPLFSFTAPMWLGVALSFIFSTLSLFILTYLAQTSTFIKTLNYETNNTTDEFQVILWKLFEESLLKITSIYLLQSISMKRKVAKDRVTKYLMACVLLLSLLIATSYSSGLASSMTIPRYQNAIRTRQDLIDSGIRWGATSNAWITSIQQSQEKVFVTLVKNFIPTTEENLKNLAATGKFALSIERLAFGNYAIGNYIQRGTGLIPMVEDLYWEQCVIMTRKNSILLPSIDSVVLRISESGLPAYWESQYTSKYLDAELQRAVKYLMHHHGGRNGPTKLKWIHVEGAFGVLVLGGILSIICFILEIMSKCYKRPIPFTH